MGEEPDGDELLVSELWRSIIAHALITSLGRSIVQLTDKEVDFNQ